MHIEVRNDVLGRELALLEKIVAAKPVMPILAYALIRAEQESAVLSATDIDIGLTVTCAATVTRPGAITVPVRTLLDLVQQSTSTHSTLIAHEKNRILYQSGAFKSQLNGQPVEDFPHLPSVEPHSATRLLWKGGLQRVLSQARCAVMVKGHPQYYLSGILVTCTADTITAVATDGNRLAQASAPAPPHEGDPFDVLLPVKLVDELRALCEDENTATEIVLSQAENHIFFTIGGRFLFSRKIDGKFPAYQRAIPHDLTTTFSVYRTDLLSSIKRHLIVHDAIRLSLSEGHLDIRSASADIGEGHEQLAVEYQGPNREVVVRGEHLVDYLTAATGAQITCALQETEATPLVVQDATYLQVLLALKM